MARATTKCDSFSDGSFGEFFLQILLIFKFYET